MGSILYAEPPQPEEPVEDVQEETADEVVED